jgi:hypothetical protein
MARSLSLNTSISKWIGVFTSSSFRLFFFFSLSWGCLRALVYQFVCVCLLFAWRFDEVWNFYGSTGILLVEVPTSPKILSLSLGGKRRATVWLRYIIYQLTARATFKKRLTTHAYNRHIELELLFFLFDFSFCFFLNWILFFDQPFWDLFLEFPFVFFFCVLFSLLNYFFNSLQFLSTESSCHLAVGSLTEQI